MKRTTWIAVAGLLMGAGGTIAWACADGGYGTRWDAESSSAILSPGNDTRSNFILLMADRYGTKVADPAQMKKGIVPFDFPYKVMLERLSPPSPNSEADYAAADAQRRATYGVGADSYDYTELCHSNGTGAHEFEEAVNADAAVPTEEKAPLLGSRRQLAKACDKAAETRFALDEIKTREGRAFAHYLEGTRLFYAQDMLSAAEQYGAIGSPSSPWLAEAASYMKFRVALVEATNGSVGEYGEVAEVAKRDRTGIDRADAARLAYLQAYPNGRYARSARNLERRIAWLRGDSALLGRAYSSMLAGKPAAGSEPDTETMHEIDLRILPKGESAGVTDPTLLAIVDLMRLRPKVEYEEDYHGPELNRPELDGQRRYFESQSDLFGYLLAAEAYYHRKQPREVLALIPDAAHQQRFSYVQFSRQMLRGLALEAVGDRNARGFWLSLLPGANQPYQREAVELAIYQHDQRAGAIGRLLETGSPILHPLIRQKIIEDDAGPELLRRQASAGVTKQQREVALYLLLANELHHARYHEFLADRQLVGARPQPKGDETYIYGAWSTADYDPVYVEELSPPPLYVFAAGGSNDLRSCPDIIATATNLAANPGAVRPQLCLAEFIRRKGFDGWSEQYDSKLERMVSRPRNGFTGKPVQRMDIYRAVMHSATATADDKAFALNRAIRCYQPSGYNSCGGDDVEKPVRKAWFTKLKSQYSSSPWAQELKYYW